MMFSIIVKCVIEKGYTLMIIFFFVFSHELICTLLVIYSGLLSACILYRKLCKFSFIPAQDVYVSILQM